MTAMPSPSMAVASASPTAPRAGAAPSPGLQGNCTRTAPRRADNSPVKGEGRVTGEGALRGCAPSNGGAKTAKAMAAQADALIDGEPARLGFGAADCRWHRFWARDWPSGQFGKVGYQIDRGSISMRQRSFGRSGWPVSEVGYGMWGMGGWTGSDDAESLASLDRAVELRLQLLRHRLRLRRRPQRAPARRRRCGAPGPRLFVATKIPPKNRRWPGAPRRRRRVFPPDHIVEMTEKSLAQPRRRAHRPAAVPRLERRLGRRRRLAARRRGPEARGPHPGFGISVNRWEPDERAEGPRDRPRRRVQVVYNVFDQAPEDELFPACQQAGHRGDRARALRRGQPHRHAAAPTRRGPRATGATSTSPRSACPRRWRAWSGCGRSCPTGSTLPDLALRFILHHPRSPP